MDHASMWKKGLEDRGKIRATTAHRRRHGQLINYNVPALLHSENAELRLSREIRNKRQLGGQQCMGWTQGSGKDVKLGRALVPSLSRTAGE